MLLAVNNGGFSLGGGTESEARFKTPVDQLHRRPDGDQGRPPVRVRRQRVVLEVAVAGQRAVAGTIHLHGHEHRPAAGRLPQRQPEHADSGDAELARHAAAVSGPLRAGHVEVFAQGHVELRPALGAGPAAADPQRRDLQLQRRSLSGGRTHHAVPQCAAGIPVSGRRGLCQRQGGDQGPLAAVLAARRLRLGSSRRRPHVGSRRLLAGLRLRERAVPPQYVGGAAVQRRSARHQPGGRLRRPVAGDGQRDVLPVHHRTELAVPADGAVHLDPAGLWRRRGSSRGTSPSNARSATTSPRPARISAATPIGCGTCGR